jgi:hypothetical protein
MSSEESHKKIIEETKEELCMCYVFSIFGKIIL